MKRFLLILPALVALSFPACEKKPETVGEKIGNKVDDALDRRPGEKVKDAGEDLKDAAKDAKDAVKDAVK
jgi:hypothetical protein